MKSFCLTPQMAFRILDLIPRDTITFLELFGAPQCLLFAKPIGGVDNYNDQSKVLVDWYFMLAEDTSFKDFLYRVRHKIFDESKPWHEQRTKEERVAKWFCEARKFFDDLVKLSDGYIINSINNVKKNHFAWDLLSCEPWLKEIHARFQVSQIECITPSHAIWLYDREKTFIFANFCANTPCLPDEEETLNTVNRLKEAKGKFIVIHEKPDFIDFAKHVEKIGCAYMFMNYSPMQAKKGYLF